MLANTKLKSCRAFNLAEFSDGKPQQLIPASLASHENELYEFHKHCNNMVMKILGLFAIALQVRVPLFSLHFPTPQLTVCRSIVTLVGRNGFHQDIEADPVAPSYVSYTTRLFQQAPIFSLRWTFELVRIVTMAV